jgi:hypothetical protein
MQHNNFWRVFTKGANSAMEESEVFAKEVGNACNKYIKKDWGDLCEEDKALNEEAIAKGG